MDRGHAMTAHRRRHEAESTAPLDPAQVSMGSFSSQLVGTFSQHSLARSDVARAQGSGGESGRADSRAAAAARTEHPSAARLLVALPMCDRRQVVMMTGSYGALLRLPRVPAVLGTVLLGRLPTAMMTVAIVLGVTGQGGSYARAGVLSGAHAAGAAVAQPVVGRLLDRRGRRPVLLPLGIGFAVSCGLLVA